MITLTSFLFMSLVAFYMFFSLISGQLTSVNAYGSILILMVCFFAIQLKYEWKTYKSSVKRVTAIDIKSDFLTLLALTAGAYITFFLNHSLGLGSVLASSTVGLMGAWFFKRYATAIYCGSFIGMACNLIFNHPSSLFIACLVSGTLFILSRPFFIGYGGKLGFLAFCGTLTASYLFQTPLRTIDALEPALYPLVILFIVGAGLFTYALQRSFEMDAVSASALVGLLLGLVHPTPNHVIVVAAFCASFTGMVSPLKVRRYSEMLFLSLLTSVLYIAIFTLFDGAGGKLGATAFLTTVSGISMLQHYQTINRLVLTKLSLSKSR